MNQKPLRSLISRILNRPLVIPTYVCVALKTHVIDHKNPTSVFSSEVDGIGTVLPTLLGAYVPKYLRLDSMSDIENKVDVLLATSALPLGIFPPVALEGGSYVDGGTMDNLPVYPLINGERIGELVIIHLTSQRWTGEDYVTHYNNCHTNTLLEEHTNELAKRIRQMKYPKGDRGGFEHSHNIHKESERILKDLKTRGAKSDPMRIGITRIAPSESLGGFLTGTLRFTPGYVDRLIRQGKSDATKIILSGAI